MGKSRKNRKKANSDDGGGFQSLFGEDNDDWGGVRVEHQEDRENGSILVEPDPLIFIRDRDKATADMLIEDLNCMEVGTNLHERNEVYKTTLPVNEFHSGLIVNSPFPAKNEKITIKFKKPPASVPRSRWPPSEAEFEQLAF